MTCRQCGGPLLPDLFGEPACPDCVGLKTPSHPSPLARLRSQGLSEYPTATCGNCRYLVISDYHGRRYYKCGLTPITRGAGTDVRCHWRGCKEWEVKER